MTMATQSRPTTGNMKEQQPFISAVLAELSRRKVLRTMGAYAVGV
jgi:hypothetical protein